MRYERLLEPVSEAEPCGPDLDELNDPDFQNYVGEAEALIPESWFKRRDDEDAKAVNLGGEVDSIGKLLERSRHLRLLILEARLQAFHGSLEGFADVVVTMAGLAERFWNDVHPRGEGKDFTRRANFFRALEDRKQIIIPLQHRVLVRDRRIGPVSMRREMVASGVIPARQDEEKGDPEAIRRHLKDDDNLEALQENHRAARAATEALDRLRATFIKQSGYQDAPSFDELSGFFKKTLAFLEEVRPELAGAASDEDVAPEATEEPQADEAVPQAERPAQPAVKAVRGIGSRAAAATALGTVEDYFLRNEPSAPALILVHKARALMNRPLVESIAALMPTVAEKMVISFKGHASLRLTMADMREITASALAGRPEEPERVPAFLAPPTEASTRAEAAALLAGVEAFLRGAEPASAVPILLRRAQEWMGKDFAAIVAELLPS